jgi:sugar/nucleoside kinase (ribokinase family)
MSDSFDLIIVGHLTIDEIGLPGQPVRRSPGGPVTFASLAATRVNRRTAIISKVGEDFPDDYVYWLAHRGVNLDGLHRDSLSKTTKFRIIYEEGMEKRSLRLVTRCSEIMPKDIPSGLNARAVHLGPVAGEVSLETARHAREICNTLSIDLQGYVRRFSPKGETTIAKKIDPRLIEFADVIKTSEDELAFTLSRNTARQVKEGMNLREDQILVVTRGRSGSTILKGNEVVEIPSYPTRKVRDPTGAGDAFIGVLVSELEHGNSLKNSAVMGTAAASFVVEGIGPTHFGNKRDVSRRAHSILERTK